MSSCDDNRRIVLERVALTEIRLGSLSNLSRNDMADFLRIARVVYPNVTDQKLAQTIVDGLSRSDQAYDARSAKTALQALAHERAHNLILSLLERNKWIATKPPGSLLQSAAEFLCSPKSYEQVIKPLIADLRYEYFEALSQQRAWKARWIRLRYLWSFCKAMGLLKILQTLSNVLRKTNLS